MRGAFPDSTSRRSQEANFVRLRDLYVTLFAGVRLVPQSGPLFRQCTRRECVHQARFRSARSAVDESGDFSLANGDNNRQAQFFLGYALIK